MVVLTSNTVQRNPHVWGKKLHEKNSFVKCVLDMLQRKRPLRRTGPTTQLCLSPGSAWSRLCICHRNAPPSCWIWRSSRWCSRCLRRRCKPCAGCTLPASRSYNRKYKQIRKDQDNNNNNKQRVWRRKTEHHQKKKSLFLPCVTPWQLNPRLMPCSPIS